MCSESMSEPGPTHALSQENTTTRSKKLCSPGYMRTALSLPSLQICAGSSHSEERSVAPRTLPIYRIISSKKVRDDVHHRASGAAPACRPCNWMYIIPSSTPKSTSRGNEERNLPKLRLKGDDAWFMILFSTSSKRNHQSAPSASPQR